MSVRSHASPPVLAVALIALLALGAAAAALWRTACPSSLDAAAALLLVLVLRGAGRRGGAAPALALAAGVIAGAWLGPAVMAPVPTPPAAPGLPGAVAGVVLLLLAWLLGRGAGAEPMSAEAPAKPSTIAPAHPSTAPSAGSAASPPTMPSGQEPELVAQVVHELRSPLNAMSGWLHVLEAGAEFGEDTVAKARLGLRRAVDRQRDLIDSLEELARAASGELSVTAAPVELRALLERSIEPALAQIGDARAPELARPQPGPALWVEADAQRLGQAIVDVLVAIARPCAPGTVLRLEAGVADDTEAPVAWIAWSVPVAGDERDGSAAIPLRMNLDGRSKDGLRRPPLLAIRRARAIAELHGGSLVRADGPSAVGLRLNLPRLLRPDIAG